MKDCIFCKIINGEIPANKIYEDENFIVIMDVFPASKGHLLVLPKKHYDNAYLLNDELKSKILFLMTDMGERLKERLNCTGYNILFNIGSSAGQTVFHCHGHVIPTYDGKTIISWENNEYKDNEDRDIYEKIRIK